MNARLRFTALASAVALVCGLGTTGPAALAAPSLNGPVTHPDQDHAGSGLMSKYGLVHPNIAVPGLPGLDVSSHQGNVDWNSVAANGAKFAYVKATENTNYQNPFFAQQYIGSFNVGLVRGAYHFATPNTSSGAAQADFFASHGGGWSADGQTLPGMLDIEYNPYGATCYGLSQGAMTNWIHDFVNEYQRRTSRWAVIYSTFDWWNRCTGNAGGFSNNDPFNIANYSGSPGTLPAGYGFYTFWQWADHGVFPGDQDVFNGSESRLVAMANNTPF